MRTGGTLVRVVPNPSGGWDVRELFLPQGIFGVIASPDARSLRFWFGLAMTVMGVLNLTLVVASRRRNRLALATDLRDQVPEPGDH